MRKFRCIICIVSLALMLCICFAFVSCSSDEDGYGDLFEALSQYYETTGEALSASKISEKIVITLPAGCSADLLDSAKDLAQALSPMTDTEIKIKYDADYKATSKEIELLIGSTDRAVSADLLGDLRINDYGYCYDGGKIVVAGHTDLACAEAVDLFISDVLSGTVDMSNVKAIEKRIVRDSYELEKIILCGFEASEYAIVYPYENELGESAVANILASEICDLGGYVLPVISDREMSASTRAICVGRISTSVQDATDEGRVTISIGNGGHVEILAKDAYGLRLAASELVKMIKGYATGKSSKVDIDEALTLEYGKSDLKIFAVNEAFGEGDLEKYSNTVNAIRAEAPTVALLYDCSDAAAENLKNNLGEISSLGGRVFYIMADGVRLIDSDFVEVGDGAVYKLTFEMSGGDVLLRMTIIGVIEPSQSGEELYSAFSKIYADSDEPTVVLFDMPEELEEDFLESGGMEKKGDGYYANSCGGAFLASQSRSAQICDDLTADVIETVIYFNK